MGTQKCGTPGSLLSRCLDGNRSEALRETDHGKSTTTILQLPCPAVWRAIRGQQHPDSHAAGVLVCDNCRDPRALALSSGTGPTIVADFQQRRIHGFDVEYDRELRRYRATRAQIPGPINASFNRIMGMLDNNVPTVQFAPRQRAGRGVQYEVHPDDPQYANGISFPEEHKNLNAYDVVQMATERSRLEGDIGKAFTGATTSSAARNGMATFLSSIGLSFVSKTVGIDSAIYRITWRDGSKPRWSSRLLRLIKPAMCKVKAVTPRATRFRMVRQPIQRWPGASSATIALTMPASSNDGLTPPGSTA